jgi:hypothetical protein
MYASAQNTAVLAVKIDLETYAMNPLKRLPAFFLAIVFVSALGCAGGATQESAGEYVKDSWITAKVKASLAEDAELKAVDVNVKTFRGVVQLSGFVNSSVAMYEAIRVATEIKGVISVKNNIRIK